MGAKMSFQSKSSDHVETKLADMIPDEQSQAEIFKLKMDHFEELFDWLSLEEMVMLSQTCQRMQHIVGYYIKTNCASIKFKFIKDGIHICEYYSINEIQLNGWSVFIKKLTIPYLENVPYDRWKDKWSRSLNILIPHMKADQFKSLTEIQLNEPALTDKGITCIKGILGQLETVKLYFPHFRKKNEFYSSFLRYCINIKRLCVRSQKFSLIVGTDNTWLQRNYPTLVHFELSAQFYAYIGVTSNELKAFFKQNSQLKTFATDYELIMVNWEYVFCNADLKLDILSIQFDYYPLYDNPADLLNQLYERGFYQQLHVYFSRFSGMSNYERAVNHMTSYKGLTKLFIDGLDSDIDLPPLINIKYLCIDSAFISNPKTAAKELINLEFLQFKLARVQDIIPFVRYSPKLCTIVFYEISEYGKSESNGSDEDNDNEEEYLNVAILNKERTKLINAKKVTIYLEESVYLKVKWAKSRTNWSLIEIKRCESFDALTPNFDYHDL